MTTTTGEGTEKLTDWALREFFPCEECEGKRFLKSVDGYHNGPCPFCTTDEWLAALVTDSHNAELWAVVADIWEERGDQRAADLRMVARLLPLDKFPDVAAYGDGDEAVISGWWDEVDSAIWPDHSVIGKEFPLLTSPDNTPRGIIEALREFDTALSKLDTALQGVKHA